jgi:chloride channel protein, CIC family
LAPLFTICGGVGALIGSQIARLSPGLGVDPRIAGLVGMAAIFAGASHALLASIVFAFETTRQPVGLLPLLAGCSTSYLVALMLSRTSIMTEKLARRGTQIRSEYMVDHLSHVLVRDVATRDVVTVRGDDSIAAAKQWLNSHAGGSTHQAFPVVDANGLLLGVVTRRELLEAPRSSTHRVRNVLKRTPVVVYEDSTLRDAADQMVLADVGRLPVVQRGAARQLLGIVTRSDLLAAHAPRLEAAHRVQPAVRHRFP